jgi:two-component system, NarL family, sensor histidine kinase EvgS
MILVLRTLLATLLLFAASFTGCVLSAEEKAERKVVHAVYGDFYPYNFTNDQGDAAGYSVDLLRHLAQKAGYEIEFTKADNPKQFFDMIERGEVDVSPLLAFTPERRALGLATSELGQYQLSLFVRHDHDLIEIEGLAGRGVGVVTGSISQAAAALLTGVEIVQYQKVDALVLALLSGEIEAIIDVAETFEARLRSYDISDRVRKLQPPLAVSPYGYIVRKDMVELHSALENAIQLGTTPASLSRLRDEWFGLDRSVFEQPWFDRVAMIVGGIALSNVSLGIYCVRLRRRSTRLMRENSSNRLLIDALDKMRAAIVIFDRDMKAVHWNSGFEAQFADLVEEVQRSGTLGWICAQFKNVAGDTAHSKGRPEYRAAERIQRLRAGQSDQRIVHTPAGDHFDMGLFPLGTRYFAAIWVDITELHAQQEHIADQGRELVRKNNQLLAFSSMAAHDLKAPLMQQRALVDFIAEDIEEAKHTLPDEVQRNFTVLSDLSNRMSLLVSDLLDFAKAGKDEKRPQSFVPNTRLASVLKLAMSNAKIKLDIMPDMPAIFVEPTAFDMVMRNLISNAVKHHHCDTGRITIRAYTEASNVIIEVEDDGPGISPEHRDSVFDPFSRLTNVEGTGLGLAFVQKTVTAWGGEVRLRAAANHGCVFSVSVPASVGTVVRHILADASFCPMQSRAG